MTVFRKCRLCTQTKDCEIKANLKAAIKGLHITSVLHRCAKFDVGYKPGDPILLETYASEPVDQYDEPPECVFPGHFIGVAGTKLMVFVKAGQLANNSNTEFEPRANGFCKVTFQRVSPNPYGTPIESCHECGERRGVCDYESWRCPFKKMAAR